MEVVGTTRSLPEMELRSFWTRILEYFGHADKLFESLLALKCGKIETKSTCLCLCAQLHVIIANVNSMCGLS